MSNAFFAWGLIVVGVLAWLHEAASKVAARPPRPYGHWRRRLEDLLRHPAFGALSAPSGLDQMIGGVAVQMVPQRRPRAVRR